MNLPINDRIDPESVYMILLDGEPLIPKDTDCIMDYWTAETIVEFVKVIDSSKQLVIQQVYFIDDPKALSSDSDKGASDAQYS